jgi:hypothetical protein
MSTNVKASHMHSKGEKTSSEIHFEMPLGATQFRVLQNTSQHDYLSYMQGSGQSEEKLHHPMHVGITNFRSGSFSSGKAGAQLQSETSPGWVNRELMLMTSSSSD